MSEQGPVISASGLDPALLDPPWPLLERFGGIEPAPGDAPEHRTNMVHRMLETLPVLLEDRRPQT